MLLIAAEASRSRPSAGRRLQHSWSKSKELSRIGPPPLFTSANGEVISKCSRFAEFRCLFSDAWLVSADGQLLVTASRLFGEYGVAERVATTDLFHDVARIAVHRDLSFAIYGATADENAKAPCSIRKSYPLVRITRSSHGYLTEGEQRKFVAEVAAARTDILWVCPWRSSITNGDRS